MQTVTRGRMGQRAAGRTPWGRALLDVLPLVAGYLPFALILGAAITASPLPDLAGWATSPLIFAGAAQLALIDLLGAGVPAVVVIATVAVINLRHVMYSGALAPWLRDYPLSWRLVAPYLLSDPVYTLATVRFPALRTARERQVYYGVLGGTLLLCWALMTALGMLVGASLPPSVDLGLAIPLTFLALLGPTITDRPAAFAALVGAGVTVAAQGLPLRLGLITGALSGVAAGLAAEGVQRARSGAASDEADPPHAGDRGGEGRR